MLSDAFGLSTFYDAPPARAGLLLGYAALDERDIRVGVERLARLLAVRERRKAHRAS